MRGSYGYHCFIHVLFFPRAMADEDDDDEDDDDDDDDNDDADANAKNFRWHETFEEKVWVVAIDFDKKSLKLERDF